MKTYSARPAEVEKKWVLIDADGLVLGRLASIRITDIRYEPDAVFYIDIKVWER